MACHITVDHNASKGITLANVLQKIYIQGTANNCNTVQVTLTCGNLALPPVKVQVVGGNWYHNFINLPQVCHCGGAVKVKAECVDGKEKCINVDFDTPFDLNCKEEPPPVPVCPPIKWLSNIGDCNPDGTRTVTISVTIQGQGTYSAELRDSNNNVLDSKNNQAAPFPLTYTANYPAGSTKDFFLYILKPQCGQWGSHQAAIPPCSKCPNITSAVHVKECEKNGDREVTVTIDLSSNDPYTAELRLGNQVLKSTAQNVIGNTQLKHSGKYPSSTTQDFVVVSKSPGGCGTKTISVSVPGCAPPGGGSYGPSKDPVISPPGGSESWKCFSLRLSIILFSALAALAAYIALCIPATAIYMGIAAATFAAAATLMGLAWGYDWFGLSCPKPCQSGKLISWQIMLSAGLGALYLADCCIWLWAVGAGLVFVAVGIMTDWALKCKAGICYLSRELSIVIVSVVIPVFAWASAIPVISCMNPWVYIAVSALASLVAGAVAACWGRKGNSGN